MQKTIHRRAFLKGSFCTGIIAGLGGPGAFRAGAIPPINRDGSARLLLSLAAYSFREYFLHSSQKQSRSGGRQIDLFQFMDFCADNGCHGAELTSYYFPPDFSDDFLLKIKRHAFLRGLAINGTAVGNTFTHPPGERRSREIALVKKWIDHAQLMSAHHIRVFAGSIQGTSKSDAKKLAIDALQECCDYAARKGVFLGLENHGGIVAEADDLLEIVQAVQSPWFGINLDTGNFNTEDPYGDLARCAPYSVNVQVKTEIQKRGQPRQAADLPRLVEILRKANYQGYVVLEYEAAEDPWKAVPRILRELKGLIDIP
jgi:sugar phosphate isomerase/epimerase